MTSNEQFSQLAKKNNQDQQTIDRLQKKEKNQKIEITRLETQVKQFKLEAKKNQENMKKKDEKYAIEKQAIEQKISELESTLAQMDASATTAKAETAVFQRKLKEAEEDRDHLKTQVANAAEKRPNSEIAKKLMVGFSKLLDAQFGAPDAGGDSLLVNTMREGTGVNNFFIFYEKVALIFYVKNAKKCSTTLNKAEILQKRVQDMKECQICNYVFDHDQRQPVKIKCSHVYYCKACMMKCHPRNCPNCREPFSPHDIKPLHLSFL